MKVVVAIDGSSASNACFERVLAQRWPDGTQLRFVTVDTHAIPNPLRKVLFGGESAEPTTFNQYVEQINKYTAFQRFDGDPATEVVKFAEQWRADLIVVGANQKTLAERIVLGSVSRQILDLAPCAVLIVRDLGLSNREPFGKVLVGLDSSAFAPAVMNWIYQNQLMTTARLRFVTVIDGLPKRFETMRAQDAMVLLEAHAQAEDRAHASLDQYVNENLPYWQDFDVRTDVAAGDAGQALVSIAEAHCDDLIIVGSHGYSGLGKLVLGSVSSHVAGHAKCSVLVLKPVAYATAEEKDIQAQYDVKESGNSWNPHMPVNF